MKSTVQITYEVDLNEIQQLSTGYQVLQHDTKYNLFRVLQAHIDFFAPNMQRYKYYLFKAPPLPAVN